MLDEILMRKQEEVSAIKNRLFLEDLKVRLAHYLAERSFRKAINVPGKLTLVAELKRRSPSKGMLRERFDPVSLGQVLQEAGASALSVLTDEMYFGGRIEFLRDVKPFTDVPLLRKDFIIDPIQIYESALHQADAILLIVRALTEETLTDCMQAADQLGIEPLVEVHSEEELRIALRVGAHTIGINHRDLDTFKIDPSLSERLVPLVPAGKTIIVESGLQSPEDIARMKRLGVHAVLIGESLMVAQDPAAKVKELFAETW